MIKTRIEMIIETLRDNPDRKFTARELAQEFLLRYPEDLMGKRLNPRYDTEEKLIAQLAAEIGGERTEAAKKRCLNVATRDKPRPRIYYWEPNPEKSQQEQAEVAVSDSSWANYGYLVATGINNDVEAELQMLASLHGIGILLLDIESLFDSQILIPARERAEVDWQSVNRIATENSDFHRFIEQVGIYNQTRRLVKSVWNK